MKKIILILLTVILIFSCKEKKNQKDTLFQVRVKSGMFLRSEPSIKAKKIVLLPHKSVLKKISPKSMPGKYIKKQGKWINVEWTKSNKKGWVFDAYLEDYKTETLTESEDKNKIIAKKEKYKYLIGEKFRHANELPLPKKIPEHIGGELIFTKNKIINKSYGYNYLFFDNDEIIILSELERINGKSNSLVTDVIYIDDKEFNFIKVYCDDNHYGVMAIEKNIKKNDEIFAPIKYVMTDIYTGKFKITSQKLKCDEVSY